MLPLVPLGGTIKTDPILALCPSGGCSDGRGCSAVSFMLGVALQLCSLHTGPFQTVPVYFWGRKEGITVSQSCFPGFCCCLPPEPKMIVVVVFSIPYNSMILHCWSDVGIQGDVITHYFPAACSPPAGDPHPIRKDRAKSQQENPHIRSAVSGSSGLKAAHGLLGRQPSLHQALPAH